MKFKLIILMPLANNIAHADDLKLVSAARKQVGVTKQYDPNYTKLEDPNGHVELSKGLCTDVLNRALRTSPQLDLQKLVHKEMAKNFTFYPKKWGSKRTDAYIDDRRVPNLQVYFGRSRQKLAASQDSAKCQAGDIVTVMLPSNFPHIMVVGDKKELLKNTPLVIHNIGRGAQEEASLFLYQMTGHYRLPKSNSNI